MKIFRYISILFLGIITLMFSCKPEYDELSSAAAPDASQLDFTITPVAGNDFKYTITNTSKISGIVSWDLGNGTKSTKPNEVGYYALPKEYTITLTLYTKGGSATITKKLTTTKTDWSIFTDPKIVNLTGGSAAVNGKTWVLDSLAQGHLGVGPAGGDGLAWWSAAPLDKKGKKMYDDEITFKLVGFSVELKNNGQSYVNKGVGTTAGFSNPVPADLNEDPYVNFTPAPGTWMVTGNALQLTSTTPIFPIYYCVTTGTYNIVSVSENKLVLTATGFDNNAWHFELIPKGYVKPQPVFELAVATTSSPNEESFSLSPLTIPAGMTVNNVIYDFGDGSEPYETVIAGEVVKHTYQFKGNFPAKVTLVVDGKEYVKTSTIAITSNHPDYIPYILDQMVMYNDFGENILAQMASGDGASLSTVANPDKSKYPNRSSNVGFYSKNKSKWANSYLQLPVGRNFNISSISTFKMLVYGTKGDTVLLKLENTNMGGNAWQTGVEKFYIIKKSNTWEVASFDFAGAPSADLSWDPGLQAALHSNDVKTDARYNSGYYNVVRIMYRPGNANDTYSFYYDDLSGPHVEGLK